MKLSDLEGLIWAHRKHGVKDVILFMNEESFNKEFDFFKILDGAKPAVPPEYKGVPCVALIRYMNANIIVIDPASFKHGTIEFPNVQGSVATDDPQ